MNFNFSRCTIYINFKLFVNLRYLNVYSFMYLRCVYMSFQTEHLFYMKNVKTKVMVIYYVILSLNIYF